MAHLLVDQLHFTRRKWQLGLEGVSAEDAVRRLEPMNCISWMVGHLAYQEHFMWVEVAQGRTIAPELEALAWGQPASTPPLGEMWAAWERVIDAANVYLQGATARTMLEHLEVDGKPYRENVGTMLLRNIYHYWYHLGEALAVRQMLGHTGLPQYIGPMTKTDHYRPL
jgi:hypothetical protein